MEGGELMAQANFRVIDPNREHARDLARRKVKQFRTLVERERLPICNQSTGARNLFVDEVLRQTERELPEAEVRPPYRPNPYFAIFLILFSIVGLVILVNSMR